MQLLLKIHQDELQRNLSAQPPLQTRLLVPKNITQIAQDKGKL